MNSQELSDWLKKLRAGDPETVNSFLEKYRPVIHKAVELRLAGTDVQRTCDASDICQDVLPALLEHLQKGHGEFDSLEQLEAYLHKMALNKFAEAGRRQRARGAGKLAPLPQEASSGAGGFYESLVQDSGSSPSQIAGKHEVIDELRRRFSPDLLPVLEMHLRGMTWPEIGAALGRSAHALETRFNREVKKRRREIDSTFRSGDDAD